MMRSNVRSTVFFLLFLAAAFLLPFVGFGPAAAEEETEKKEAPIPPLASDEEAVEMLKAFKVEFKARGLRGEEKIGAQAWALTTLSKVQHPKVVDEIAKHTRNRDADLRTGAVLALGNLRRLPGYAGKAVVTSMKRHMKDTTYVMAALESVGKLRYLGAKPQLAELMKHHEYAVVKNALVTIGRLDDARFIADIVKLMKELKLEKGASWDGVNVTYDTGTAGDHDQKMAEKIGKAQEAKNKKKGKRAAKSMRDLGPIVLEVMYDLTGERFTGGIEARKWLQENRAAVDAKVAAAKKVAEDQAKEADAMKKRR